MVLNAYRLTGGGIWVFLSWLQNVGGDGGHVDTYKGRIEALRKRIGNGYNIPIFISNKICFIKIGKIYWVNYFKIKCVLKNGDVVLINGEVIKGGYSYRTIVKKIKLIKDLLIEQKYS